MCFHLIVSVPHPPINYVSTHSWPFFGYVLESNHFQAKAVQTSFRLHSSFAFISPLKRLHYVGPLRISTEVRETSDVDKYCPSPSGTDSFEEQTSEEVHFDSYSSFAKMLNVSHRESERRRKIGLANKGNVPWNKGIKHGAETRARIKQRTIEALRDPKVKSCKSQSVLDFSLIDSISSVKDYDCKSAISFVQNSDESRSKIGSSLRRIWRKRLNFVQLREKFYLSWATTIAIAAKKGGIDQDELDWHAYDKLIEEVAGQKLQRLADKAQAKEMTKLRKERAAVAKAARLVKLVQRKKAREEKEKMRETLRKSREEKEELENAQELKLKQRLTKIHRKKSINIKKHGEKIKPNILEWETLDLEFIKREKMRKEVSLEEQIRAAKNKKEAAAVSSEFSCLEQHKT